ncbi:MAG: hypothetical protein WBV82_20085 [Myxococcaceae bacterium]
MGTTAQSTVLHLHTSNDLEPHEQLLRALARDREEIDERMHVIHELAEARDEALEQVDAIRGLAERSMTEAEALERELESLKVMLAEKDEWITELEKELEAKTVRLEQVERTLKMLAEADENENS